MGDPVSFFRGQTQNAVEVNACRLEINPRHGGEDDFPFLAKGIFQRFRWVVMPRDEWLHGIISWMLF